MLVRSGAGAAAVGASVALRGAQVERTIEQIGALIIKDLDAAGAAELAAHPDVRGVAQDYEAQFIDPGFLANANRRETPSGLVDAQGTDQSGAFFYPLQWNIHVISADDAWAPTPGGAGAVVCVLDTGVDPGHQDLVGKVDLSISTSFVATEPFIEDLNAHGTYVSSIVSSNGIGIASVAPDATLCAVKVLAATGSGSFADVISGIVHAAVVGADVINMSLGAYVDRNAPGIDVLIQALTDAVEIARELGSQVVAAAGNNGANLDEDGDMAILPGEIRGVLSVAATAPFNQQNFDMLASYSNYGSRHGGVDIAAPGGDLLPGGDLFDLVLGACSRFVCGADGFYLLGAGTSGASPHVAGAGAVVESVFPGDQGPRILDHCILTRADKIINPNTGRPDRKYGAGRLNVLRAATQCN
ncbi:MAG: S8 family serine peptidase [Gemmatimonadota bacterium]|nr:S8 family serine peptidase [Gemmatimonadota bacterium]